MTERPSVPSSVDSDPQSKTEKSEQETTRQVLAEVQALSTRITAVQEIITAINQSLELDEILKVVGNQAKWLLDFDSCSVCLIDETNPGPLKTHTLFGKPVTREDFKWADQDPINEAIKTNQAQLIRKTVSTSPYQSIIVLPLGVKSGVLGTINFVSEPANVYGMDDLRIVYLLALQLASAIHNANQFKQIRSLYRELEQAYDNLNSLEGMRDQLIHMIAHDLRNPISVMINTLDLLNMMKGQEQFVEKQYSLINRAMASGRRSLDMIDDMLTVSKLEAGGFQPVLGQVSLQQLISDLYPSYQIQAQRDGLSIELDFPDQLPTVLADSSLIGRVVDNLVGNAIKYTDTNGKIIIGARAEADHVEVTIQDNGQGIQEEFQQEIFNKFSQAVDESGKPIRQGLGLGLTFCRLAIEAHNGRIWVDSILNVGSTFHFTLPITP